MRADFYELIKGEVTKLFAEAHQAMSGGLRMSELWTLIESTIESLVTIVEQLPASGAEKKEAVLELIDRFYDEEIRPLDMPLVPDAIFDPMIGAAIRPLASLLIDAIVAAFGK